MVIQGWQAFKRLLQVSPREYFYRMNRIGDIKVGTLKGVDRLGNKYYENDQDEIIMRTRWVEYTTRNHSMDRVEPGWRAWLVYTVDTPPNELAPEHQTIAAQPPYPANQIPAQTGTPGNYVPYSTVRPKLESWTWEPKTAERVH